MSLTPELLNQRLADLAKLTEADLNELTVKAIRKKISDCGVTAIDRNGKQVAVNSARRSELIDAILKMTAKDKLVQKTVPELTPDDLMAVHTITEQWDELNHTDLHEFSGWVYKQLRDGVQNRWNEDTQEWLPPDGTEAALAGAIKSYVERQYPGVEQFHTRLNARGAILKVVENLIKQTDANTWIFNELHKSYVDRLRRHTFQETKADSMMKKDKDLRTDKVRATNRSIININQVLSKAYDILKNLDDNTPATRWKDVSLALGLVSGRRPFSEVLSTGEVEITEEAREKYGEYGLTFYGQAKVKGRSKEHREDNPGYEIPCLVPANLVVNGFQWLQSKGKRVSVDLAGGDEQKARTMANKRFSKEVSQHMKHWAELVEVVESSEKPKQITAHTLRELYALAACRAFGGSTNYEVKFAASILGHFEEDSVTAQKYQQDFLLSDDSICKLP
jgi:hypothetical protein